MRLWNADKHNYALYQQYLTCYLKRIRNRFINKYRKALFGQCFLLTKHKLKLGYNLGYRLVSENTTSII